MANRLIHDKFVGAYVYAIKVDGVIRYIGKGRRYRAIEHFRLAREINRRRAAGEKIKALPFQNRLAKAMREGRAVDYEVIVNGLDDKAALDRERAEISAAVPGQLWNIAPGGEGTSGDLIRRLWQDPAFREKTIAGRRAVTVDSEEWRDRQRQNAIAQWADPEKKRRHHEQHRKLWDDPVAAEERRELLRKVWADPDRSAKKSELVKSQWTPERRAAMSENRRRAWADPVFKARASASIRASKAKK